MVEREESRRGQTLTLRRFTVYSLLFTVYRDGGGIYRRYAMSAKLVKSEEGRVNISPGDYRLLLGFAPIVTGSYAFSPSSPVNISTSNSAEA